MEETRNPYIILGIPFAADVEVAKRAFVRRMKSLNRHSSVGNDEAITDLTWAHHQISEVIENPVESVDIYRVPANAIALRARGNGIFAPQARLAERETGTSDSSLKKLLNEAREELVCSLLEELALSVVLPLR